MFEISRFTSYYGQSFKMQNTKNKNEDILQDFLKIGKYNS